MALIFPSNPSVGDVFQSGDSASYQFDGVKWVLYAPSPSYNVVATEATNSIYSQTASYVENAQTASYVVGSNVIGTVANAVFAITASHALNVPDTASYALEAQVSATATTASYALEVENVLTASYANEAFLATSASWVVSSSQALKANEAIDAITASYAHTAVTASHAQKSDFATQASSSYTADKIAILVKNNTSGSMVKGTLVAQTENIGDVIVVKLADRRFDRAVAILNEDLGVDEVGEAILVGKITGVNTGTYNVNDNVWLGEDGEFVRTKPTGSGVIVQSVGVVIDADVSDGTILSNFDLRLTELPTLSSQSLWIGDDTGVAVEMPAGGLLPHSASFSLTASYVDNLVQDVVITGSLVVTDKIVAQTFETEYVTSSVILESGSTKFGNSADDTHLFTGSVSIDGKLAVPSASLPYISESIEVQNNIKINGTSSLPYISESVEIQDNLIVGATASIGYLSESVEIQNTASAPYFTGSFDGEFEGTASFALTASHGQYKAIADVTGGIAPHYLNPFWPQGDYSSILGGSNHNMRADNSVIAGGINNGTLTGGSNSAVLAGQNNSVQANRSAVIAGNANTSQGQHSVVVGGYSNKSAGEQSVVIGGHNNEITNISKEGIILGGYDNHLNHSGSAIIGSNISSSAEYTLFVNNIDVEATASIPYISQSVKIQESASAEYFTGSFEGRLVTEVLEVPTASINHLEVVDTASIAWVTQSLTIQDNLVIGETASISYFTQSIEIQETASAQYFTGSFEGEFLWDGNDYELHVSQENGKDETGRGSFLQPFKTIQAAINAAGTAGYKIIVHRGVYVENVVLTNANTSIEGLTGFGPLTQIDGTLTINPAVGSTRLSSIRMNGLIYNNAGALYMRDCMVTDSMSLTGNGYVEISQCDLETANATQPAFTITGTGTKVIEHSKIYPMVVNNAGAVIYLRDNLTLVSPTLVAGTMAVISSNVYPASPGFPAITTSANTILQIYNSQVAEVDGTPATINVGGFLGYEDITFDKENSTLGTQLGVVADFQKLRVNTITGSLDVSGSMGVHGDIILTSGSLFGTASYALNAVNGAFVNKGNGNIVPAEDYYVSNSIDGNSSGSVILTGDLNNIDAYNENTVILGISNSVGTFSSNNDIWGDRNFIEIYNQNNFIIGDDNSIDGDSHVLGRHSQRNTILGDNNNIFGLDDVIIMGDDNIASISESIIIGNGLETLYGDSTVHVKHLYVSGNIYDSNGVFSGEAIYSESFDTPAQYWLVSHSLGKDYPQVTTWQNREIVMPDRVYSVDENILHVSWSVPVVGSVIVQ